MELTSRSLLAVFLSAIVARFGWELAAALIRLAHLG